MSTTSTTEEYDYIVVGAGSAGAAIAAGLADRSDAQILLLEAGPEDSEQAVHIPAAFSGLFRSPLDWNYDSTPQPELDGRCIFWPRGRMLGGSSSINAMMWVRGFAADYDEWAERAGADWSYEALLPYFRRIEAVEGSTDPDHGTDGAVAVSKQRSPRSHTATFLRAVEEVGLPIVPPNTANPDGFSQTMVSQRGGTRFSSADAYLRTERPNLTIRTLTQVTRVVIEDGRAVGVEIATEDGSQLIRARSEVVLAAGAVNTPQLLMLSGIGDAAHLTDLGISVHVDAPEVGRNLADHLFSAVAVEAEADTLFGAMEPEQMTDFGENQNGMLTSNVAEAYGFTRSREGLAHPDIEILFAAGPFIGEGLVPAPRHGYTIGTVLLRPKSSGTIRLASADPLDKPIINPEYLSDPDGADRATMLAGLRICEQILDTSVLRPVEGHRFIMPEGAERLETAERDALALAKWSHTLYHPVGTARMGSDEGSVVDPQLRVRGVRGLRVADASIMPVIIRGHTNAPSIMIGAKAADLLLHDASYERALAGAGAQSR